MHNSKYIIAFLSLCLGMMIQVDAQNNYINKLSNNFGMSQRHLAEELPFSRASIIFPERVKKVQSKTDLKQLTDVSWQINDGWELADADSILTSGNMFAPDYDTSNWLNATVPGTVLTTLVKQGIYPDPYFGVNNMAIPEDICRKDWWYRIELPMTDEILAKKKIELLFNGINYEADVWFNGIKIGSISGAFIRGRFDITSLARKENVLAVHIFPPRNPGIPHEQSSVTGRGPNGGVLCLDGPTFISSEGWDWVPGVRDRNIGIWQDVELIATEGVTIRDTKVVTDLSLPRTDFADLFVETELVNDSGNDRIVDVNIKLEDISISKTVEVCSGASVRVTFSPEQYPQLRLMNPRLWMPNGYGEQNLYKMQIDCVYDGNISDKTEVKFGVREYTYELTVDSKDTKNLRINYSPTDIIGNSDIFNNRLLRDVGNEVVVPSLREDVDISGLDIVPDDTMSPYLVIRCNGVRIFCKGGNWGMDDMMKCCTREHLEPYLKLHKEAGFTMVRNWTGESTEEVFYELCDEYGLMVWNDFWMSTEGYNLNPSDEDLFMSNALDAVKRFRNHPSIAIWCPRNEGYATETLENRLTKMLSECDGTRFYSPNSRNCNLRPSGPWHYFTDASKYYTEISAGFNTELGSPSVPTARTIRKFMAEEDQWPISEVWHYHDLHPETVTYVAKVSEMYGEAKNLDDFCKKVQIMNYDSYRAMFEAWNSRMWNNTSGVLLWMTHPAWPSVEWQSYSYDYETFGSWFGCKKACEQVHVQMNLHNHRIVVINNSLEELSDLKVRIRVTDLSGSELYKESQNIDRVPVNALKETFVAKLPVIEEVVIARVELLSKTRKVLSQNDYVMDLSGTKNFKKLNELPSVELKAKQLKSLKLGGEIIQEWVITNSSSHLALFVKLNLENSVKGTQVLPAIFSDGYFNMYPGEKKIVTVKFSCSDNVTLSADGYNVSGIIIR